jgi:hypothetical protein
MIPAKKMIVAAHMNGPRANSYIVRYFLTAWRESIVYRSQIAVFPVTV